MTLFCDKPTIHASTLTRAKIPTHAVSHTVKENPGCVRAGTTLYEGHIVTGLDTHNGKQFHGLAWHWVLLFAWFAVNEVQISLVDIELPWSVGGPLCVSVTLWTKL